MNDDIIIMGDIHGEFALLNSFLNAHKPEVIIQVGDFGYFPKWTWQMWHPRHRNKKYPKQIPVIKSPDTKILWVDGNHDDHESLQLLTNPEVFPNVFYQKRGSTMTLPDGRTVLFVGGAASVDRLSRQKGIDWFPQENITQAVVTSIDVNTKVDIVISHTCPAHFSIERYVKNEFTHGKTQDSNREVLSYILKTFNPKLWYFGHWHRYATGFDMGCRWVALDHITNGGKWWVKLDKV